MTQPQPQTTTRSDATPPLPWWRFGMVWLVLGGPAVVVVASFITLFLALTHIDPVIGDEPASPQAAKVGGVTPTMPAMQGRNHAATPAR